MIKKLILIFTLKKMPTLSWSSSFELNFKPKIKTLVFLIFGLILFGLGETLLVTANIGLSPWFILQQGVSLNNTYSLGLTTFGVGVIVLLIWIPLKKNLGLEQYLISL